MRMKINTDLNILELYYNKICLNYKYQMGNTKS